MQKPHNRLCACAKSTHTNDNKRHTKDVVHLQLVCILTPAFCVLPMCRVFCDPFVVTIISMSSHVALPFSKIKRLGKRRNATSYSDTDTDSERRMLWLAGGSGYRQPYSCKRGRKQKEPPRKRLNCFAGKRSSQPTNANKPTISR